VVVEQQAQATATTAAEGTADAEVADEAADTTEAAVGNGKAGEKGNGKSGDRSQGDAPDLPEQASQRAVQATQAAPGHGGAGQIANGQQAAEQAAAAGPRAEAQAATQAASASVDASAATETASTTTTTQAGNGMEKSQNAAALRGTEFGANLAERQERVEQIAQQLATRLRLSHAAGGSQVQLHLKPRELGSVQVELTIRDGVVAASVLVDKPDTARLMENNLAELKRSLESQGLDIQHFSVDVRDGEAGAGARNAELRSENAGRIGSGGSDLAGAANATPGLTGDDIVTPEDTHNGNVSVLA
jgi:flagellar hook-length control protein FliK